VLLVESFDRVADRTGDAASSTSGAAAHRSSSSSEADGTAEFGAEELAVALGEFDASDVVESGRLVDVVVDLGESSTVGLSVVLTGCLRSGR